MSNNGMTKARIADALESCNWAGDSIGNKAIIAQAVNFLRSEQRQGEPIMLTAVATLVENGEDGLEPSWILEGGTAELFAGMTMLVAENAPDLCSEDGSAEVYLHPPAEQHQGEPVTLVDSPRCGASCPQFDSVCGKTKNGNSTWQCGECARREVAALRTKMEKYFGLYKEADEHVNHWQRQERAKARWAKQVEAERDTLRAQLAERDALLGAIAGWTTETRAAVLEAFQDELNESASYAWYDAAIADLMKLVEALSASAEPSERPGCFVGAAQATYPSAPKFGVLAGEPEILGERCADGGKCHHLCKTECFRKDGCVPLSGSGLTDDWKEPSAPVELDERDELEAYCAKVGLPLDTLPTGEYLIPATRFVSQGWHAHAALGRKSC